MSIEDRIAKDQPASFAFTAENEAEIKRIVAKYPKGRQASAVMPLLDLAQRQNDNWIPVKAIELIAKKLGMAQIRVLEVATFYTMFNLKPVGKYFLQACTTTPCWLRGSDEMMRAIKDRYGIDTGQTSACGRFSLLEVECLGACVNAPILQVNDDFYEDLDYLSTSRLLDSLEADDPLPVGSVVGRCASEPLVGATSLTATKRTGGKAAGNKATEAKAVSTKKRGKAHA